MQCAQNARVADKMCYGIYHVIITTEWRPNVFVYVYIIYINSFADKQRGRPKCRVKDIVFIREFDCTKSNVYKIET